MLQINKNSFFSFVRRWYIFLIIFLIYAPLLFLIVISFNGHSIKGNIIQNITSFDFINYIELFKNDDFLNSLLNSILVVLVVMPVSVIIAVITCFGMWHSKKHVQVFTKFLSNGNTAVPDIITGVSLSLLFTMVWLPLGLEFGYASVVISHISFCVPYAIVAIYPRMISMKVNLINASNDLGASNLKTFFKVIMPYLMPSIIAASVIVTAISFDDFVITSLVSGNFNTISTSIYQSSKGIKAWIVTFGAIMVFAFILVSIGIATHKIMKDKKGKKYAKKII